MAAVPAPKDDHGVAVPAPDDDDGHEDHAHVHFDESSDVVHEHKIEVKPKGEGKVDVHVGILKIHHRYEVKFLLQKRLLPKSDHVTQHEDVVPNKNCRLLKIVDHEDDSHAVVSVELVSHREKMQRESLSLQARGDDEDKTVLTFHARVLGKGKGTPMLREGVHLLEAFKDPDESECGSDWTGFDG